MRHEWKRCRNLLCVRADNMGDIIMSGPAFRTLKENLGCRITLLTSPQGAPIVPFLPFIDEVIVFDFPWVKTVRAETDETMDALVERLRAGQFDAGIVFTVYSQSALPAALCLLMADIPLRLAYARENPYHLLSHWVPDTEPYECIYHQVVRDLRLLEAIGLVSSSDHLELCVQKKGTAAILKKANIELNREMQYLVLHPGVSEGKRRYPANLWKETVRLLRKKTGLPLLVTGSAAERDLVNQILPEEKDGCYPLAGTLSVSEWIEIISGASGLLSVNTAAVHIAAAVDTPVVVLYALTNPQHVPWKVRSAVLPFSVPGGLASKNPVIRYVADHYFAEPVDVPRPENIVRAVHLLLEGSEAFPTHPWLIIREGILLNPEWSFSGTWTGSGHEG